MCLHRRSTVFLLAFAAVLTPVSARAAFHLWYIKEVFSNHDGSVQFIELFTNSSSQEFLAGQTLTSNAKTFNFTNSPSPTNNHHLLLATAGFGSITGGAAPNYAIPANFFNKAGDTLTFAGGFDVKTFASAPTDGVMSLNYTGPFSASTIAANTPRNYAGAGGTVNLPPPASPTGDYNGNGTVDAADFVLWRDTLNQSVTAGQGADGNANGTIDAGDYDFWSARFGNTVPGAGTGASLATVPEPAAAVLMIAGFGLLGLRRRR